MPASHTDHVSVPAPRIAELLLPEVDFLRLDDVVIGEEGVTIRVTCQQAAACCPDCGQASQREHSWYTRRPSDLPCVGRKLRLEIRVRRFFCDNGCCARTTFVERLPGVVKAFARRTERLAEAQREIGLALGGQAGARHSVQLHMPTSPDTLLRLVGDSSEAAVANPKVLGIDDWAWRKRQRYGTILIDLERHCVVDILSDRSVDSVAAWLQAHPGVEIISRDRGGIYAEGARRGAPQAVQVADRWHLLSNLREALKRLLDRRHADLPKVPDGSDRNSPSSAIPPHSREPARMDAPTPEEELLLSLPPAPNEQNAPPVASSTPPTGLTQYQRIQQERRQRRLARYQQVMQLHEQGVSMRAIAEQLGMGRQTVRRYVNRNAFPEIAQRRRLPSILDRFEPYLVEHWTAGCSNALQLYREILEQGYTGSHSLVSRWAADRRRREPAKPRTRTKASVSTPAAPPPPRPARRLSPAQAAWLLVQQPLDLTEDEQTALDKMQSAAPEIGTAYTLAQEFIALVSERASDRLRAWIERALNSCGVELRSFAKGLQQDLAAVTAGLSLPWSNGQTEGQINRLKLIKRTMYGRAGFDLLRQRVLAPT
jgi:transposase